MRRDESSAIVHAPAYHVRAAGFPRAERAMLLTVLLLILAAITLAVATSGTKPAPRPRRRSSSSHGARIVAFLDENNGWDSSATGSFDMGGDWGGGWGGHDGGHCGDGGGHGGGDCGDGGH